MLIYSYVVTSLPEKVQVYNNPTTSSTAIAYTIGWSGHAAPAACWAQHRVRVEDSSIDRAEEDGPADAWLVETAGFAGWLEDDGAPS